MHGVEKRLDSMVINEDFKHECMEAEGVSCFQRLPRLPLVIVLARTVHKSRLSLGCVFLCVGEGGATQAGSVFLFKGQVALGQREVAAFLDLGFSA